MTMDKWISVKDRLPDGEDNVLAVKELKNGDRQICIAYCNHQHVQYDPDTNERYRAPYWVCGGNNNILFWMPLPEIPKKEGK